MRCPGAGGVVARTLLPARLLDLGGQANADQSVVGLELLHRLRGVVDQGKAGGLAATVLCPQAEDADLVLLGLVHGGKLFAKLILGDVGAVRVEDVTARVTSDQSATPSVGGQLVDPAVRINPSKTRDFGQVERPWLPHRSDMRPAAVDDEKRGRAGKSWVGTHTTICLRPSRGLRMNLRVRSVTGVSTSAILAAGWRSVLRCFPRSRDREVSKVGFSLWW